MDRSHDNAKRGYFQYVCRRCGEPFFWPVEKSGRSCPRCEPTTLEPPHQTSIPNCYTRSSDQAQQRPTWLGSINQNRYTYNHDLNVMEPSVSQSRPDLYPSRQRRAHHKRRPLQLPGIRDIPVLKYALDTTRPKERDYNPPFLSLRSDQDALLSFQPISQTSHAGQPAQHIQGVGAQAPLVEEDDRAVIITMPGNAITMNNVGNDRPLAIPDTNELWGSLSHPITPADNLSS
ncbi:hypothetical protein GGR51DRAFT_556417 [Nemania sp. FL0031]|nr:hypothetical protein GGR51DRAFT_556417 [Nemania sp. FL0031]